MTLEERITRLETQNRFWRRMAFGFALGMAALIVWSNGLLGPAVQSLSTEAHAAEGDAATQDRIYDKVRLRKLEIVNEKGQPVVSIGGRFGGGDLTILSDDRKRSLSLMAIGSEEPTLWIKSEEGKVELTSQRIFVVPADHKKRARQAELIEKLGSGRSLTPDERQWFQNESAENPAVQIGFGRQGGGIIGVYNPLGKEVASIQSNKTNQGAVYVNDVNGKASNALLTQ